MTPIEGFLKGLLTIGLFDVIKVMIIFGLVLYLVFAVVVIRQVELMLQALNGALDVPLKLIVGIHLLVAIGVFLVALVVL